METYQTAGQQSSTVQVSEAEETFEQWLYRSKREKRKASFDSLLADLAKLPPEVETSCTPPRPALPGAGGHSVEPSESFQPGEYFTLPGLAPGLVIKHINGKNSPLPKNVHEWKPQDKQGFLKQSPLSDLGKSRVKAVVTVLQEDVKIRVRTTNTKSNGKWVGGKRGSISELSRRSCLKLVETARNVTGLVAMVTLTYPAEFPCDGKLVKRHLVLIRKWLLRRGVGAFWFLEFQRRGAPHFHLFTDGIVDKADLSRIWYKIVSSGDEKHLFAGTKVEAIRKPHAIATYAAKYAAKAEQKTVPAGYEDVGRFWGNFGAVKVVPLDQETGTLKEVAPLVRVIRKLDAVRRKRLSLRPKTHKGRVGFTSYGTSEAVRKYLLWQVPF